MSGFVITKRVCNRWTYYLEYLQLNGKPMWTGLKNNAKGLNLVNAMLVLDKLRGCYPDQDLNYE